MDKVSEGLNFKKYKYFAAHSLLFILYVYSNLLIIKNDVMGLNVNGLPISDSEGWSACIHSLAIYGELPSEQTVWCNRRPTYVFFGSLIWRLVGSDQRFFFAMNFLFFIILCAILITLKRLCFNYFVKFLALATGSFVVWRLLGMTQFMSEQFGILLALSSVLFLLKYLVNHNFINLLLSSFFVVQAELARPGNIAIILLPLVFYVLSEARKIQKAKLAMLAILPIATFTLLKVTGKLLNYKAFMTDDYNWYGLYGLVHGNYDWTFVLSKYSNQGLTDTQIGKIAREQTISKFIDDPLQVIGYMLTNIHQSIFVWAPGVLGVSSSLWFVLLLVMTTFAIKRLIVFRSWSIEEKSLMICAYLALFAFVGILGINRIDPFRTLSNSIVVLIPTLIYIVSPLKQKISAENAVSKEFSGMLRSVGTLIACCSLLPLVIALAHLGPNLVPSAGDKADCHGASEFRFLEKGLQVFSLINLPEESKLSWWGKSYESLDKNSQIYRGFFLNEGQTLSYRSVLVMPRDREIIDDCITTETPVDQSLRNLNLSILRSR